jgi:uncharacterized protein (DUF2141 family)
MKSIFLILLFSIFTMKDANTPLNLTIKNIKSDQGTIRILIFDKADGFPEEVTNAVKSLSIPVKDFAKSVVIADLPAGTYAISLFHDEDNDGKLKKNGVGLPSEAYGFSNNPTLFFGPPSFSKCAFTVNSTPIKVEIKLK